MTSTRRHRLAAIASLGAVVVLIAACTDQSAVGTPGAPAGATTPAATQPGATTGAAGSAAASQAASGDTVTVTTDASIGDYLLGANGMSIYLFKNDEDDKSNCTGNCFLAWPPLTVPEGTTVTAGEGVTGTLGTIKRDDGSTQVTINKQPLYYFSGDKAAGSHLGQGVNEVWYLVQPTGDQVPGGKGSY